MKISFKIMTCVYFVIFAAAAIIVAVKLIEVANLLPYIMGFVILWVIIKKLDGTPEQDEEDSDIHLI